MARALFSFEGRMNRAPYWGLWVLLSVVGMVAIAVPLVPLLGQGVPSEEAMREAMKWPAIAIVIAMVWPVAAVTAKRLQDLDHDGSLAWALVAPPTLNNVALALLGTDTLPIGAIGNSVVGIVMLVILVVSVVYLGCIRGTQGPNRFGSDPLARAAAVAEGDGAARASG